MCTRMANALFRRAPTLIPLVVLVALLPLSAACAGGKQLIITATPAEREPEVVYVTATFTPGAPTEEPPPQPTADIQATLQAALAETMAAMPSDTPVPPTDTPVPPTPDLDATVRAAIILTQAAAPSDTPLPPTKTPTKKPSGPTRTPTAVSYPPPVLTNPPEEFNCYNAGGCTFSWTWGRTLGGNEYFQVQLIGPGNEHRGIHPPTKNYSFTSDESVYWIVTDWCNPNYYCHIQWTVAVVEWDGVDPGKIGRMLVEAAYRWVKL